MVNDFFEDFELGLDNTPLDFNPYFWLEDKPDFSAAKKDKY